MTRYVFSDSSRRWLEENGFSEEDIEGLQGILNRLEAHNNKDARLRLPKDAGPKVTALATLLDSITDVDDRPICFEASGMIEIPDEAKAYFDEDLELDGLERAVASLKKVKFARRYSYPRRRGTMKDGRMETF